MTQPTIDLHVNPSDETIRLGPLAVPDPSSFAASGVRDSLAVAA